MTKLTINIGATANDKTGDTIRAAFNKVNSNFTELYTQISGLELDAVIPSQTGNNGKILTTNGTTLSWSTINQNQLVNNSYSLSVGTDGSVTLPSGAKLDSGASFKFATDNGVTQYIDLRDSSGRGFYTDSSGFTLRSNGSNNWIFDPSGILNLPQNNSAGAAVIQPSASTYGIKLISNGNTWAFGTDGALTFPDNTLQTTAWTGILPSPTYSGSSSIGNVTPAPLNLNNTGSSGQVKTQLTLINTAGNANTGSAIDFFTYTGAGNGVPGARIQSVDDGNFSSNFSIALKTTGGNGNGSLTTLWTFGSDGNLTFPDNTVQTTAPLPYVKTAYNAANATATMGTVTASWVIVGLGYHVVYSTLSSSDVTYAYSGMNIIAGVTTSFNSSGTYVMNAANNPNPPWFVGILNTIGDVQIVYIQDITNSKVYRVTAIATTTYAGYSPVPGSILIEQII